MKRIDRNLMTEEKFDLDAYFERINYSGSKEPIEETLNDIHICHTLNVPFENLDVFYGKPPLLDEVSLYNKIVKNRRGGYCFEMNGIFSVALKSMGFRVTNLLARVTIDGMNFTSKTSKLIFPFSEAIFWHVSLCSSIVVESE